MQFFKKQAYVRISLEMHKKILELNTILEKQQKRKRLF